MVRTAQEHSPTKERLLDAAERLMLAKGFVATTVDEICEAAKLTKGSFFHYFESKEELGKELLERFCASSQEQMQHACCQERDPLKRLYGLVDFAIKTSQECAGTQGCLLGTFAQELADTHPEIRSVCSEAFGRWSQMLKHDLDEAKAAYAPKKNIDTQGLAELFIAVLEGSKILAKATQDAGVETKSLQHFKRYLESLFEV